MLLFLPKGLVSILYNRLLLENAIIGNRKWKHFELNDVSVNFSGLKALSNVSFNSYAGEVRAVIGPN